MERILFASDIISPSYSFITLSRNIYFWCIKYITFTLDKQMQCCVHMYSIVSGRRLSVFRCTVLFLFYCRLSTVFLKIIVVRFFLLSVAMFSRACSNHFYPCHQYIKEISLEIKVKSAELLYLIYPLVWQWISCSFLTDICWVYLELPMWAARNFPRKISTKVTHVLKIIKWQRKDDLENILLARHSQVRMGKNNQRQVSLSYVKK